MQLDRVVSLAHSHTALSKLLRHAVAQLLDHAAILVGDLERIASFIGEWLVKFTILDAYFGNRFRPKYFLFCVYVYSTQNFVQRQSRNLVPRYCTAN